MLAHSAFPHASLEMRLRLVCIGVAGGPAFYCSGYVLVCWWKFIPTFAFPAIADAHIPVRRDRRLSWPGMLSIVCCCDWQVKRCRNKGGLAGVDGIKSVFGQLCSKMTLFGPESLMLPHRVWKVKFIGSLCCRCLSTSLCKLKRHCFKWLNCYQ